MKTTEAEVVVNEHGDEMFDGLVSSVVGCFAGGRDILRSESLQGL